MKHYLKPLVILLPVISIIFYYLVTLSNRSEFSEVDNQSVKAAAYDTLEIKELKDWRGNNIHISNAPEPIIIMHFWASWCEPCIHEFPDLIKLAKNSKGRIKVMAISEDKTDIEIEAFIKSFKDAQTTSNFHILWDKDHEIMNKWEVTKLPESYIFGPDRKLAKHVGGVVNWTSKDTFEYFKILESSEKPLSK